MVLKQTKNILFLANNNNQAFSAQSAFYNSATLFQKVQFDGFNTLSQQHVFQIPGTSTNNTQKFKVQIVIEALSENFYPIVYLKRQEFKDKPKDLSELKFPTIIDHEMHYGQNPFDVIRSDGTFSFAFSGQSSNPWSYYTMVVF